MLTLLIITIGASVLTIKQHKTVKMSFEEYSRMLDNQLQSSLLKPRKVNHKKAYKFEYVKFVFFVIFLIVVVSALILES